jgi:nucleotide sugar dehydrogenase
MKIGIIGTGKLGLCMALCLDQVGFDVYCYDINETLSNSIKNKSLETNEPLVNDLLSKSDLKIMKSDFDIVDLCDVIFIFIQTPSLSSGEYDHTFINTFINKYDKSFFDSKVIAISSTVMPEYTDMLIDKLKNTNINICYNPTFIAQGSIINNLINPELILIGGHSKDAIDIIKNIHIKITKNNPSFHIMTPFEAEITKISINCFITTKISYANMIGDLLVSKNINPNNVLNAIGSDSRIGNKYLGYGFGFGGPCFPRDNRALYCYSKKNNLDFRLCKITDELNNDHLLFQFNSIIKSTNKYEFEYITYKDSSDIIEESQKLKLAVMLVNEGVEVTIKERPHVIEKLKSIYGPDTFIYLPII